MNTNLSLTPPSQIETECLVVVVLDRGEKDKPSVTVESSDASVRDAAKDVLGSAEVTGKTFETTLLHRPTGLKAKRLLLVGGGKAQAFSTAELRKLAGAAARFLKVKSIRSFAFAIPDQSVSAAEAVRAVVEGAFVGDFDPDYYKSDRKDQKLDTITIVAGGDKAALEQAMNVGRIVGESQNFTRDLVNEPSNRMTPTMMGERAKKMATDVALKCEVHGAAKIKELKMGAFWGVAQGSDEPP